MKLQNMKRSELTEQIRLFNWAESIKWFVPELNMMYHVPNEGKRQQGTGAILKAAGMKRGCRISFFQWQGKDITGFT